MSASSQQVGPAQAPDLYNAFGRAWRIPDGWGYPAGVGAWLVEQPGGHPFWRFHCVAGIHLRDVPGAPEPKLRFPEATHEFISLALDPGKPLPQLEKWERAAILMPPDWAHQVALLGDEQAREMVDLIVRHAVTSGLALDSDARSAWGGVIAKTAEHYSPGGHNK